MEIIKTNIKIIDNIISIEPENEKIQDNFQYEIRLKNFKSKDQKSVLENYNYKVVTKMSPSYCTISDVAILRDIYEIPETTILYYIREASKYVDYIQDVSGNKSENGITFPMREFVKTKVMIDCLLQAYTKKAAGSGIKGTLGVISFEDTEKYATSIDDLLKDLNARLKGWEDALKGYELEGRAKPLSAVRASKAKDSTTAGEIADSINRDMPIV